MEGTASDSPGALSRARARDREARSAAARRRLQRRPGSRRQLPPARREHRIVTPLPRTSRAGAERGRHGYPQGDPGRRRLPPLPGHPRRTDRRAPGPTADGARRASLRDEDLSERRLQAVAEREHAPDPCGHVLGHDRRPRGRSEDRRRRRRRRRAARLLRSDRDVVPGRIPEGRTKVDDPQGDRRPRLSRPRVGSPRTAADRPQGVVPRHARRGHRGGAVGHLFPGRARPPAGGEPLGGRTERLDRELQGLQRPDSRGLYREHAGDRGRLRGGRPRRHGRDQLLRRRLGDRTCQRRDDRGREQRGRRRGRARDRGRQRTRRIRPRQHRLAGLRARRDHRRRVVEPPRLRTVALDAELGCAVDPAERPVPDLAAPARLPGLGDAGPDTRRPGLGARGPTGGPWIASSAASGIRTSSTRPCRRTR